MVTKVIMPQLGESVVEGTVSRWLYKVGDQVKEYEPLLEVSTDKVDTEIPSPASGSLLYIYVNEGVTVQAGVLLAVIGKPGDTIPEPQHGAPAVTHEQEHASEPAIASAGNSQEVARSARISPVVARMAAEHNLDLNRIRGTGLGGRVTKKDVESYLSVGDTTPGDLLKEELAPWEKPGSGDLFKPTGEFKPKTGTPSSSVSAPAPQSLPRAIPAEPIPVGATGELLKLSNMRRSIAEHMVRSKLHTSPHATTVFEIDMSAVIAHREANKNEYAKRGVNLTFTAYFVAAMVEACRAVPIVNSQWTDEGIYLHHAVHIGMAVDVGEGLLVPVIRNADQLNLLGLAQRVNDLAQRARQKQIKPDELVGGTITITNHGVGGSLFAMPIINQPQAGILGVGMVEKRVKVINDAIAIRPCCYMSLTFDHRITDGARGDAWMMALKQALEGWQ